MYEALLIAVVGLNIWADFMDRSAAQRSDINALSLWTTIVQFLLVMPLVGLVEPITLPLLALSFAVGAISVAGRIPWYRALAADGQRLSRLAPFSRLSSVVVLALAVLVLGEKLGEAQLAGALVMILGSFLMSLEGKVTSWRAYLAANKALLQVGLFAISIAFISVYYKYMMNLGTSIITAYFFLKFGQCTVAVLQAMAQRTLTTSFAAILDLQLFVQARAVQTAAALLYIMILRGVDLSRAEPLAAAIGPVMFLIIEKLSDRRAPPNETPPAGTGRGKTHWFRYAGLGAIMLGLFLLVRH